jgi:hypothetical protein
MSATRPEPTGYAVTVEVFVPLEAARQEVDRLDQSWRVESWTPEAAAFELVREALTAAGLDRSVSVRTTEASG